MGNEPGVIDTRELPVLSVLSDRIARREISPRDLVEHCLARVSGKDAAVEAWACVAADVSRREAQVLADELAGGGPRGPLHGIPFGVKDIFDTAGMPTGWGSPLYAERVPDRDAELVARLKQAGAIVLGKTHTTGFAYFDPSPTRNPHNLEHTPGGSSSGSAVAVAEGMVPFALGSQTLGSVLRPASYCGVVGMKPTLGALPPGGMLPFAPTLDHAGLFTRTVDEMAWLWPALTGSKREPTAGCRHLARPRWPLLGSLEDDMAQGFERALSTLTSAGFEIHELELPQSFTQLPEATMTIFRYEGAQTHKSRFEEYGPRIGVKLAALVEEGLRIERGVYEQALAALAGVRADFAALAEKHPVWITPSALGPAPSGLASTGDPRANAPFTALGVPAISLPFGYAPSKLPLGLQLAAARGEEDGLLKTALECERALSQSRQPNR
jgi:Asp-tRNA(Asn)/Glu-tRNA(Gln) amidotransferase A subunit family amidase